MAEILPGGHDLSCPYKGTLPKGTQPEGATSEQDASRKVREMFTRIAPRYDLLNHLLSGQMDKRWRARAARELRPILERADAKVLDLCCGTGDLAFSLARGGKASVIGADFSHTMLVRAKGKAVGEANGAAPVPFFEADALRLPFADSSFDLVTTAFGFRNLANYEAGLREIQRVLKPGGSVAILEFTEPAPGWMGDAYRFYCQTVLPKVGGWISGDAAAYAYLPKSVARFFRPNELAELMKQVGYSQVRYVLMMLKSVALHIAVKSA
jgi:demethylmenaquinone methyltransferase / 2-methoxy-6-polyprenyl-1,4-benzoquinol methylase